MLYWNLRYAPGSVSLAMLSSFGSLVTNSLYYTMPSGAREAAFPMIEVNAGEINAAFDLDQGIGKPGSNNEYNIQVSLDDGQPIACSQF